ncbi:hypothetical protein LEP1GSC038_4435 [Leptospira weilii str. 2006001855]|uniref:Uncharacterized protein n=1 Tax=Leptospira weilii str. 2006001855 TaxID=996804 RepID=M6FTP5_9LEPT|nr:hypothetical protein LEP1GSC038_4435 [Leptospira weilii str. 2006001855]
MCIDRRRTNSNIRIARGDIKKDSSKIQNLYLNSDVRNLKKEKARDNSGLFEKRFM